MNIVREAKLLSVVCTALFSCAGVFAGMAKERPHAVLIEPSKAVIVSADPATKGAAEELKLHLKLIAGVDVPVAAGAGDDAFVFSFDTKELGDNSKACAWKATGTRRHPGEANESIFEDACGFSRLDNCVRL
jgi:hypothetical protein